jgi:hypothetical protein
MIGARLDALHPSLVQVNDHLAGAEADAEALEDLIGELLDVGDARETWRQVGATPSVIIARRYWGQHNARFPPRDR